jgi:hypothetical protein
MDVAVLPLLPFLCRYSCVQRFAFSVEFIAFRALGMVDFVFGIRVSGSVARTSVGGLAVLVAYETSPLG